MGCEMLRIRLSAPRTGRILLTRNIIIFPLLEPISVSPGANVAGRIRQIIKKNHSPHRVSNHRPLVYNIVPQTLRYCVPQKEIVG
jgi:hypothetical protein